MSVVARKPTEIEMTARFGGLPLATWGQIGVWLSGAALVGAVIGIIYCTALAINWYSKPFLGVLTSNQLVINNATPLGETSWTGFVAGLKANDHILKVNGTDLQGQADPGGILDNLLSKLPLGEPITVEIFRPGPIRLSQPECSQYSAEGAVCDFTYSVLRFPLVDFLLQFGIGFVVALALLAVGGIVWQFRRHIASARLVTVLSCALSFVALGRFELLTTYHTTVWWFLVMCVVAGILLELAMVFPVELPFARRRPSFFLLPFILSLGIFAAVISYFQQSNPVDYVPVQLVAELIAVVAGFILVVSLIRQRGLVASPTLRDQAGVVLIGVVVAASPTLLWVLTTLINQAAQQAGNNDFAGLVFSSVYTLPPLIILPLSFAYAVLQRRIVDSDRIVSEGAIYAALGATLIIGYLLISGAAYIITWGLIRPDNPLIIAATLFVIAVAFTPVRTRLERAVDRAFFKQARVYETRLEQFARSLTTTVDLSSVVKLVEQQLDETVAPRYSLIFLRSLSTGDYEAYTDPAAAAPSTDLQFSENSALIETLQTTTPVLYVGPGHPLPAELYGERARLAVLNTPLIVRLQSLEHLNGFLALGPRQDRTPYRFEDFRFLESLADQAAAAFERSQVIVEAQRTARELSVLAQVSAALNIIMDFDTLLEFIYTQTDKVIQAPNFYIALRDERYDELYYAFYQEKGERIDMKEGTRWHIGRDLTSEVVRTGKPIKVDNYVGEMIRRDSRSLIENDSLHAWMGVPLNAGAGSALGCLAIATTDTTTIYTADQLRIFSAIADLAATALYKARLLGEAEERARQMKALNDISSQLATEFEDIDALLKVITESAVEILRGEAGALLLREELSQDLVFQMAVGGSGQELVGSHIPSGGGIAGTVVQTGKPIIVNDTQADTRWFGEIRPEEEAHEFVTHSILAVPLTSRSGVIGVLEVINKQDGTSFVEEDTDLLTAFAGQAAIAIENARLFQTTDMALAERVQQLDNMQRIDQELNRTLDLQRVVELTIDNAMRESSADAGLLALIHAEPLTFEIVGSIGYPGTMFNLGAMYPVTSGIIARVYRNRQSALFGEKDIESISDGEQQLPGALSQLAVPLITANTVSAVLLLESLSPDAFNSVTASFTQGLAEHANTAITNSQLFAQVREANQARSKFVAFVAHELKNPMTSIKGYAEVLLGGVTGSLTDQQQNFIAVIQRNAVRVEQIITDLNDITAQETGNLKLKLGPTSFNTVVLETLRPQQRAIETKDQKVALRVPDNLPMVWGDELRLIQVMTNFVSNAHKYTPQGGTITILAEPTQNQWDPEGAAQVIHCAVSDTGIGMSEDDLRKLFTAYWRSTDPRAREQPGTGLGMTLTRGLVEAHGGKVWVESTVNVGTTFHFTVPLAEQGEAVGAVKAEAE